MRRCGNCRRASCSSCSGSRNPPGPRRRALTAHVDLHCHSTASDGACAPEDVARRAHAVGLAAIALTDHDTIAGVAPASQTGAELGVRVVTGCEFSVRAPWGELHVLGYFLPSNDWRLEMFLTDARAARVRRGEQMVEKLQGLGVDIDLDELTDQTGAAALGRPHVARALIAAGAVTSFDEAFSRFLGRGRPAFVEKPLPPLTRVTELLHTVGGIAVAAHLGDRGTERQVRDFRDQGLDAIEIRHPSHTPGTEARLLRLAQALDLGISGGSDWHGETEHMSSHAPLGGMDVPEQWLHDLEQRRPTT